ncbi:MAG: asparagine synthase (glutamine-hydrolyzing), partial [Pseudomonadota bacterium]
MCGITGYWCQRSHIERLPTDLSNAVTRLHHRGPDDSGVWTNNHGVGLGHARLSIIDLSEHGHQPMISNDGRYVLVFNGEIYNFREIRHDLEKKGYGFRGHGDTEVVLAAFQEWNTECVHRFIGMFAFAVWDEHEQRLCLFRDRIGVKPLYYGWDGRVFWFGSELKALRAYGHWQPEIDHQALGEFFQYGYICAPRSIYRLVKKLSPGDWLELRVGKEPVVRPYWSILNAVEKGPLQGSEDELAEQLEELLIDAFRYRMMADVPVGVFLSGGIDSSLVTALLQKHTGQQIHTFTIGFNEQKFDESPWAKQIAEHLGTYHTERILDVTQARDILPRWSKLYDEPFGDSSGLPTFMISQVACENVKVILSADGGDELFCGYSHYDVLPHRIERISRLPYWLRKLSRVALHKISRNTMNTAFRWMSSSQKLGLVSHKLTDRIVKLAASLPEVNSAEVFNLAWSIWLTPEVDRLVGGYKPLRQPVSFYSGRFEEQMMLWDFQYFLAGDILTKVDRATMAVSLEGREPLLDHRIAEFAFRLPLHLRQGTYGSKHILRKLLYKYVPRKLIERPKQGFSIPLKKWLSGELSGLIDHYLNNDRIHQSGILDPKLVKSTVNEFKSGSPVDVNRIWLLLAFEMWR